mgnify:CR=1 FL=1
MTPCKNFVCSKCSLRFMKTVDKVVVCQRFNCHAISLMDIFLTPREFEIRNWLVRKFAN